MGNGTGVMDNFLGELYGTNKTAGAASSNAEDFEKEASVQLFMKLAGEQNIPIAEMPDADVQRLYASWVEKSAEFPPKKEGEGEDKDEDEKKKHEKAKEEHEEKKAAAEKVAEADFLGRVMAHAYVQELQKIASGQEAGETVTPPTGEDKTAGMPDALRKGLEAARGAAGKAKGHAAAAVGKAKEVGGKAVETAKAHKGHAAAAAGGAAAGGAAGFMAGKSKKASSIDLLAVDQAVHMAHEQGFDAEEAGRKVAAVMELGLLGESTKIASAPDYETAVGIRALEFLEAAGYAVTWNQ